MSQILQLIQRFEKGGYPFDEFRKLVISEPRQLDELLQAFRAKKWHAALAASEVLGRTALLPERVIPRLISLLTHRQPQVRQAAAKALGLRQAVGSVPNLLNRFYRESNAEVLVQVIGTLATLDAEGQSAPAFFALLQSIAAKEFVPLPIPRYFFRVRSWLGKIRGQPDYISKNGDDEWETVPLLVSALMRWSLPLGPVLAPLLTAPRYTTFEAALQGLAQLQDYTALFQALPAQNLERQAVIQRLLLKQVPLETLALGLPIQTAAPVELSANQCQQLSSGLGKVPLQAQPSALAILGQQELDCGPSVLPLLKSSQAEVVRAALQYFQKHPTGLTGHDQTLASLQQRWSQASWIDMELARTCRAARLSPPAETQRNLAKVENSTHPPAHSWELDSQDGRPFVWNELVFVLAGCRLFRLSPPRQQWDMPASDQELWTVLDERHCLFRKPHQEHGHPWGFDLHTGHFIQFPSQHLGLLREARYFLPGPRPGTFVIQETVNWMSHFESDRGSDENLSLIIDFPAAEFSNYAEPAPHRLRPIPAWQPYMHGGISNTAVTLACGYWIVQPDKRFPALGQEPNHCRVGKGEDRCLASEFLPPSRLLVHWWPP